MPNLDRCEFGDFHGLLFGQDSKNSTQLMVDSHSCDDAKYYLNAAFDVLKSCGGRLWENVPLEAVWKQAGDRIESSNDFNEYIFNRLVGVDISSLSSSFYECMSSGLYRVPLSPNDHAQNEKEVAFGNFLLVSGLAVTLFSISACWFSKKYRSNPTRFPRTQRAMTFLNERLGSSSSERIQLQEVSGPRVARAA